MLVNLVLFISSFLLRLEYLENAVTETFILASQSPVMIPNMVKE